MRLSFLCPTLLIVCLAFPLRGGADPDPWFAQDKMLHFGVSAALAAGGYAAGTALWDDRGPALLAGAGLALGAGVGKELLDLTGYGHPSWRDLAWDVVGTGAGLLFAWGIDSLVRPSTDRPATARHPPAALSLSPGRSVSLLLSW